MQLIEIAEWEKRFKGRDAKEEQDKNGTNNPDWAARWKTLLTKDCDIRDEWQTVCELLIAPPPDPRPTREIKERGFDLGHVSTCRRYGSGGQFLPAFQVLAFTEATGMPPSISSDVSGVEVGSTGLSRAALWLNIVEPEMAIKILMRTCTSDSDDTLKRVATRETIAQLDAGFVKEYVNVLLKGAGEIATIISANKKQLDHLRVAIELLSRLALRLVEPAQKHRVFEFAITLANNYAVSGHLWLAGTLSSLLNRIVKCFEFKEQVDLVLPLLKLPTEGIEERVFNNEPWWDEFLKRKVLFSSLRDTQPEIWTETVSSLLVDSGKRRSRRRAVWRLTFLYCSQLLTELEQQRFAKELWDPEFASPTGLPGEADLHFWVFLTLPEPERGTVERIIKTSFLSKEGAEKRSLEEYLTEFGGIINTVRERKLPFGMSTEEVAIIATRVMDWVNETYIPSISLFADSSAIKELSKVVGVAEVLPFIQPETYDLPLLLARIDSLEKNGIECYLLYPSLITHHPEQAESLTIRLQSFIGSDNAVSASIAINAISFWLSLAETGHAAFPPDNLFEEVGLAIYLRREPVLASALKFATQVFRKQPELAKKTFAKRAIIGLGHLFNSCQYEGSEKSSLAERVDIPLLRYFCTKLAVAMWENGYSEQQIIRQWIEAAKDDPLPEVRNLANELPGRGAALETGSMESAPE